MPRLFGRSSKGHQRDQYEYYGEYEPAQEQYGYEDDYYGQSADLSRQPSAWRKALSRKKSSTKKTYHGEQQYSLPPGLYHDPSRRTAVEDYYETDPHRPASSGTESFAELLSRSDSPIPMVQRESSLSRLQEAFADHGTYAPAISQQNSGMPSVRTPQYGPRPLPPGHGPVEMSTVNEARHQPMLVNNVTPEGIRPDVLHAPDGYRVPEKKPERRRELPRPPYNTPVQHHDPPVQPYRPTTQPYKPTHRHYDQVERYNDRKPPEEYPPAVVVVEKGRHGKKDTYYIIPGGVPVVFEDEEGNELTRVGDFSGNYRPTKPRPIIVEDSHGREIFRTGFDDNQSSSSRSRYDDEYYRREEHSSRRSRPTRHEYRDYDERSSDYSGSREKSSRRYDDYEGDRRHRSSPRQYDGAYESYDGPNVVYIDPLGGRSPGSVPIPSRSTSPKHIHLHSGDVYSSKQEGQYYTKPRSHDSRDSSSNVIYLDDVRSQSSRSSGSRGKAQREHSRYR
ncbi:hypothetical protein OBBRIDRAFT_832525 [Obba rivulosa]|uniref:Uncharacterized protein n=1 Tax=Obba rivulosa TaxID=1052685 RepID=A0A8E2J583_9APHY|nr:hypothetical protein OBBRIDRAFT_832525 [Obba rivulosa]